MARRVFFSFHYDRDIWRSCVVRNSWVTQPDREAAGFWDASLWEETKRRGDDAIRRLIDSGLENTSVTVVLIGSETAGRTWIEYEIRRSFERGNALLGVYIHNIRDREGRRDSPGANPFEAFVVESHAGRPSLARLVPTYDWILDDGYTNLGRWVDAAARGRIG